MKKFKQFFILLSFFVSSISFAAPPLPKGPVNDFANVIDPQSKEQLISLLTTLGEQTKIAMVIVTIPSLEGSDIEGYAVRLYQQWGISQRGIDKGLLILTAIEDRTGRIEIGYGLEPYISDAQAGRLLREVLFPYFKKGLYGEGFLEMSLVLIAHLEEKLGFRLQTDIVPPQQALNIPWPLTLIFFLILAYLFVRHPLLFLILLNGFVGRRGFGGGMGGGFGRGFGGFGGGLSGGGGASGRW